MGEADSAWLEQNRMICLARGGYSLSSPLRSVDGRAIIGTEHPANLDRTEQQPTGKARSDRRLAEERGYLGNQGTVRREEGLTTVKSMTSHRPARGRNVHVPVSWDGHTTPARSHHGSSKTVGHDHVAPWQVGGISKQHLSGLTSFVISSAANRVSPSARVSMTSE